ncbi:hypothetical protein Glove_682g22 [Diversispora epigaea]|uniref:RRM domain-containing protein n=1 Tax=Diversispora epigaea TaxID=1348612 RepID=A0A397G6M7_9GLOM|nr:hypothetical protein Glove_682g22 [Diversispora epigaea]
MFTTLFLVFSTSSHRIGTRVLRGLCVNKTKLLVQKNIIVKSYVVPTYIKLYEKKGERSYSMSSLNVNEKIGIDIKLENENEDILPTTKKLKIEKSDDTVIIENCSDTGSVDPIIIKDISMIDETSNNNNDNNNNNNNDNDNLEENTDNNDASTSTNVKDDLGEGIQYRLRMKNVPKFASVKMIKDLLAKNGCGSLNVKKSPKWNYCFVQLKSREQQLEVIEKLKDVTLKNKAIIVTVDNITEKERQLLFDNKREANKERLLNEQGEQRSPEELLADQTTPLHRLPYSEQLKFKDDGIKKSLSTFRNKIKELTKDRYRPNWVAEEVESNLPCEVRTIISSPILEGYRNKCEFTIGKNLNGEKTVGFLLGAYKDGLNAVLEPEKSLNVSEVAKKIATAMQTYVRKSEYDVYDRKTKQGNWRLTSVRSQACGDIMIIVQFHPQGLTEDQINKEKLSLAEYFESLAKEERINLKSLLVQVYDGVSDCISDKYPYEVIYGDSFIHEEMMGCRFRISPRAFFQTNTLAAQVLYEKCSEYIKDLCNPDKPPPVLIDMCCGTGTIGICLSKALGNKIEKVIGIEICEEAVEDAKINATLNEIKNSEYILGPVEKNLRALNNYNNSTAGTVIAIVDPPRAGVHKNVIKALRNCQAIDYFLYISCDYNLATQNFIDLCRPSTNAFTGIPFKPVRAVGVDLFPHAKQVELLIEFHRDENYSTNES